ncbi:MAG: CHASE2 domain-containing protein [Treponema sp.]|nr:CHASE2 domain-containing protein [Treponema sp.]
MGKVNRKRSFIRVSLAACVVSSLLFFTSLDNKLFDLFLRFLPPLTESNKVFVITLDDDSMDFAGGFPFRREVYADVVVLLKELGVKSIVFDLSYLDESAQRFDPDYAMDVFIDYLHSGAASLNDVTSIIPHLGRDVDEYFAKALAFSGNSWLTLTMQELIIDDEVEIKTDPELDLYLAENIAYHNINIRKDTKTPETEMVMPAIFKLLSRAKGAGFVNASPDTDGLRRRINLLWKYQGNYYRQLTLAALQETIGYDSIEVTNRAVFLKNGGDVVLRVPRAQDGSMLVRWPNKNFYDYNMMSLISLIQHTVIEPHFAQNIANMDYTGLFYCWDRGLTPLDYYLEAESIKKNAFANNEAAGENWLLARQNFFTSCEQFLYGPYEGYILEDVGDDWETAEYVRELFQEGRAQFFRLAAIREGASGLEGSFSVIGSDATSMTDLGLITFQENYPNVGSYAVAANMLLAADFLTDTPWFVSVIIALLYSLLIGYLVSRFDTHLSIITGLSGIFLLCASFLTVFAASRVYLGLAFPLIATTLTFVTIMVTKFLTTSHEKAFLHNAFSRYLAPEVIEEIINDPDKLNLGGEKREMTAMFTDIQGFSTISEQLDPVHLVRLLNRYLTLMSNIVMENVGTIDKYEGDAIIAFFGAPVFRADHPVLACRSAVAMKAAERELNKTVVEEGLSPVPLFTRIGINTGEMVVGNMGAENKMDYTIMGNAVNLAARLEGVNKQYNTGGILISEYTREKIGDEFLLRRLDRVRVVGINTPLRLYEVLADNNGQEDIVKAVEQWEKAMDFYENKKFNEAAGIFNELKNTNAEDRVAELYSKRCAEYMKNPPPDDWDAVRNLTEK